VPDHSWLSKTRTRLPHEVHVAVLKALDDSPWKTRISEPKQNGFSRWRGEEAARHAVTNNRVRLKSGVAREAFKLRAEIVERSYSSGSTSPASNSLPSPRARSTNFMSA